VLTDNTEIIGAWIDKAGYNASACSLDRKTFTDIVSRSWGDWLIDSGVVNPNNELDIHLAQMTPEEIITTYYTAIDEQNFNLAYTTLSRKTVMEDYLFGNKPDNVLFNAAYIDAYDGWPQVISAAKVKSVKIFGALEYNAIVDMKFSKNVPALSGDGTYGWFVILTKEVDGLGWRIQSIGTGP